LEENLDGFSAGGAKQDATFQVSFNLKDFRLEKLKAYRQSNKVLNPPG